MTKSSGQTKGAVKRTKKRTTQRTKGATAAKPRAQILVEKPAAELSAGEESSVKEHAPKHTSEQPTQVNEWVELFPHGISVSSNLGRPVLILKDKSGAGVLPVWMNPLDAGVALAELSQGAVATHAVTLRLMEAFGLEVESCSFTDLVGHHQFVHVTFRGKDVVKTLRLRADEAMSFCLQARVRFFGTKSYMAQCRSLDADLSQLESSLVAGQLPGLQAEMEISSKKHPYLM